VRRGSGTLLDDGNRIYDRVGRCYSSSKVMMRVRVAGKVRRNCGDGECCGKQDDDLGKRVHD
jgi:hypothetical protein